MTHRYTSYFCGCLTTTKEVSTELLSQAGWEQEKNTAYDYYKTRHTYYEEFLNFCAAQKPEEGCVAWRYEMKEEDRVGSCKNVLEQYVFYQVPALHCYVLPFDIVIFAIEVTAVEDELDNFTSIAFHLRLMELPLKVEEVIRNLYHVITGKKAPTALSEMLSYGYKLKVFQVIDSEVEWDSETSDERRRKLFSLGTMQSSLSPVSSHFQNGYEDDILAEHVVSVFNNWDALALLDSFTMRFMKCQDYQLYDWKNAYFRMIFIQSLFQKYYLQSLNQRFRAMVEHRGNYKLDELLAEFEHYERICQFNKISYTFLPLIIDNAIDASLEIKEERDLLSDYIKGEEKRHESENERRINRLLVAISGLTMFSAIWDLTCLIDQVFPFDRFLYSTRRGYAVISFALFFVIALLLIACIWKMRKRQRGRRD